MRMFSIRTRPSEAKAEPEPEKQLFTAGNHEFLIEAFYISDPISPSWRARVKQRELPDGPWRPFAIQPVSEMDATTALFSAEEGLQAKLGSATELREVKRTV